MDWENADSKIFIISLLCIWRVWDWFLFTWNGFKFLTLLESLFGQDGWISAKSFFCEFVDLNSILIYKQAKKNEANVQQSCPEQAWSVKDLLYGFQGNFPCGTQWVVLSSQDSPMLAAQVANHSAGFDWSCQPKESAVKYRIRVLLHTKVFYYCLLVRVTSKKTNVMISG